MLIYGLEWGGQSGRCGHSRYSAAEMEVRLRDWFEERGGGGGGGE